MGNGSRVEAECVAPDREHRILTVDANRRGVPTVAKRPDPIDRFIQALATLAPFITALTGAATAGHSLGWW